MPKSSLGAKSHIFGPRKDTDSVLSDGIYSTSLKRIVIMVYVFILGVKNSFIISGVLHLTLTYLLCM